MMALAPHWLDRIFSATDPAAELCKSPELRDAVNRALGARRQAIQHQRANPDAIGASPDQSARMEFLDCLTNPLGVKVYYVATLAKFILVEAVDELSARAKGEEYFQGTKQAYSSCTNCGHNISTRIIRELAQPVYCTQCGGVVAGVRQWPRYPRRPEGLLSPWAPR